MTTNPESRSDGNLRLSSELRVNDLCRLCLNSTPNKIGIFSSIGRQINLSETILLLFNFHVLQDDHWPQNICVPCCEKLTEFHGFYSTVKSTEATLVGLCGQQVFQENDIKEEEETQFSDDEEKVEYLEEVEEDNQEISFEFLDDSSSVKEEVIFQVAEAQDVIEDTADVPEDKLAEEKEDEVPSTQFKDSKASIKQNTPPGTTRTITRRAKLQNSDIKNIELTCELCSMTFAVFTDLKKHFREIHNRSGYVKCCNFTLSHGPDLLEHMEYHRDPKIFECTKCEKTFKALRSLQRHLKRHVPPEGKQYQCDQCLKRFSTQVYLNLHKRIHIPAEERETPCPQCNKVFASPHVMRNHVERIHELKQMRVCEICAKVFKTTESFQSHQKKHQGVDMQKKECGVCGKKFSCRQGLKRHQQCHEITDQVFNCDVCSKEFKTRRRMLSHKRHVHSQKSFKCSLCEREFKHSLNLREHLATHTGQQSLYKCSFCDKMFNSNANRYVHQKRNHPNEWEKVQQKKLI